MATLDEILGGSPPGAQSGDQKSSGSGVNPESATKSTAPQVKESPSKNGDNQVGGYEELFKKLNPYNPPTPEEIEKEKKKQRRNEIFAAIGDGVMALSNLYFTTQGAPSMYNGKETMSERTKARYDKLIKDREEKNTAYFSGLMRARQADADNSHRERSWQRQLGLDQESRDRYNENIQHRNEREAITDRRYDAEQEENKRRWQATFDEGKRRADRSHSFNVQQHKDNLSAKRELARATAAKNVRGKQLGFADGNGNQVSIYENVWKGSMQQVFEAIIADEVGRDGLSDVRWKNKTSKMTAREKEDYVKQNWHKSTKASQIMLTLSKLDPATMTSEIGNESEDGLGWGSNSEDNNNDADW